MNIMMINFDKNVTKTQELDAGKYNESILEQILRFGATNMDQN